MPQLRRPLIAKPPPTTDAGLSHPWHEVLGRPRESADEPDVQRTWHTNVRLKHRCLRGFNLASFQSLKGSRPILLDRLIHGLVVSDTVSLAGRVNAKCNEGARLNKSLDRGCSDSVPSAPKFITADVQPANPGVDRLQLSNVLLSKTNTQIPQLNQ